VGIIVIWNMGEVLNYIFRGKRIISVKGFKNDMDQKLVVWIWRVL
jgi:hypothetical protein